MMFSETNHHHNTHTAVETNGFVHQSTPAVELAGINLDVASGLPKLNGDMPAQALAEPPLSAPEKERLLECERIVQAGLVDFFDVGSALLTIREDRVYRGAHATFETYCKARWGFGRSYACRVIGAAQRIRLRPLDNPLPKPANEFQVRPLLRLKPEEFPKAWKEIVDKAPEGKITTRLVETIAKSLCHDAQEFGSDHVPKAPKRVASQRKFPRGQVLALLHDIRRSLEKGQVEHSLEAVDRIEQLLYENL
jgi:hypothetical protein